jgi:hypothetical protein
MKRFFCSCGAEIFFDNTICVACGKLVGIDVVGAEMFTLRHKGKGFLAATVGSNTRYYRFCKHRSPDILGCNLLIREDDPHDQCVSCRLTRTIPVQDIPRNVKRWRTLEEAKRRMVFNMFRHHLPFKSREEDPERGLCFDFLEDRRSNPNVAQEVVYTGHSSGVITINAAEADPEYRVSMREEMNERYRTTLGHFRHEIGHYFFMTLVEGTKWERQFDVLFGNHKADYDAALKEYYANGPAPDWQEHHISAYASMHPLEDWAETWAHYLHMMDTFETAISFDVFNIDIEHSDFRFVIGKWVELTIIMNALNRSVGKPDAYPFVLSSEVYDKLIFVRNVILSVR